MTNNQYDAMVTYQLLLDICVILSSRPSINFCA